jgi:hypothetical protein
MEINEKSAFSWFSTLVNNYRTTHDMYNIKIINVQQPKTINNFKGTKEKVLRVNAAIWFNKTHIKTAASRLKTKQRNSNKDRQQTPYKWNSLKMASWVAETCRRK